MTKTLIAALMAATIAHAEDGILLSRTQWVCLDTKRNGGYEDCGSLQHVPTAIGLQNEGAKILLLRGDVLTSFNMLSYTKEGNDSYIQATTEEGVAVLFSIHIDKEKGEASVGIMYKYSNPPRVETLAIDEYR